MNTVLYTPSVNQFADLPFRAISIDLHYDTDLSHEKVLEISDYIERFLLPSSEVSQYGGQLGGDPNSRIQDMRKSMQFTHLEDSLEKMNFIAKSAIEQSPKGVSPYILLMPLFILPLIEENPELICSQILNLEHTAGTLLYELKIETMLQAFVQDIRSIRPEYKTKIVKFLELFILTMVDPHTEEVYTNLRNSHIAYTMLFGALTNEDIRD
ncbi:MAG: hypothetical protein Fur003_2400 [Candidatus Dojkabacteria bacterium]